MLKTKKSAVTKESHVLATFKTQIPMHGNSIEALYKRCKRLHSRIYALHLIDPPKVVKISHSLFHTTLLK
jgi:hypothetical protein